MNSNLTRILFEMFLVAGFLAVGAYTVMTIYGYKYDVSRQDFERVSIVDVGGEASGAVIYFDGEKLETTLPFAIRGVAPGSHRVIIEKAGFLVYKANVFVKADFVTKIDSAVLMPMKSEFLLPKKDEIVDPAIFNPLEPEGKSFNGNKIVYADNHEIWVKDLSDETTRFVSRFSVPVTNVKFFSDDYNILFVSEGKLNFCDQLMQNCYVLRKFQEGDSFAVKSEKIYYKEKTSGKILILDLIQS